MNFLNQKNSAWFVVLKSGDRVMLHQPKFMPFKELSIAADFIKEHPIDAAFYTKISINSHNCISEYDLIAIDCGATFVLKKFILDLNLKKEKFKNLKFFMLMVDDQLSKAIKRNKPFYKKF